MRLSAPSPARRRRAIQRGGLLRLLGRISMLLYAIVTLGVPLADAGADHRPAAAAHWEDADSKDCPAPHGGDACDLCQVLTGSRALAAGAPSLALPDSDGKLRTPSSRDVAPGSWSLDSQSSRAPPRA